MITTEYDVVANALYIYLSHAKVATTEEVGEYIFVDLDASGSLRGIDVPSPNYPWPLDEIFERYYVSPGDRTALELVRAQTYSMDHMRETEVLV